MMQARAAAAILALLPLLAHAGDARIANQDLIWENISGKPTMPSNPKTVSPCTVWYNNDGTVDCESVLFQTSTNRASFLKWNPSITSSCGNFNKGQSYCLDGSAAATSPTSTPPPITTTTPTPPSTTTSTGNGVQTPQPTQPDMVGNCNSFHYIYKGNTCGQITSYHSITQEQFARWNPKIGMDCTGLVEDAYACVGVIQDSTPTPTPTSTTPSNGVQTPQPTQPDMVKNCNKFHYIYKGNTCGQITSYEHISQEQFARWNPRIGADCSGMWADAYACVGVVGQDPTPTSTVPSNGIQTPQPTQGNMVKNCNKFHFIYEGNTCDQITSYNHISQHDFATWNPLIGEQCTGLWANAYACVGVY
ncbi:LysM domain protein [Cordyceps fumosorosea ARSEF 2679]|uniref:LysM domain protein n=1 Tax=Cordyceps fumosorosea (strain ARSEF 2679) TaxID=1081104 RepID=A0A167LJH7_CORFA|nr:LysM domain protein [Cordyceps fumosorosea ARSEF 2679]OAA53159.1 LysM domain protein [Cordyceps fumosorosea ARSEF 2679]